MSGMPPRTTLEWIRVLRAKGFSPIKLYGTECGFCGKRICRCKKGWNCTAAGKHPVNPGWQSRRELFEDPELLESEFATPGAFNLGLVTGSGGLRLEDGSWLVVVDVDVKDGRPGLASLAALEQEVGELPTTVTVITGSGGLQYYLRTGARIANSVGKLVNGVVTGLAPAIDIRGEGGMVVAPPSMSVHGTRYAFKAGCSPLEVPVALIPKAWEDRLLALTPLRTERPAMREPGARIFTPSNGADVLEQIRNHPLTVWATENPDGLGRELWRAFAMNIAALVAEDESLEDEGRELFHEISEGYTRYSQREADRLFTGAIGSIRKGYGPVTFETMVQYGAPRDLCTGGTALVAAARRAARGGRVVDPSAAGWLEGDDSADVRDAMASYSAANEPTGPEAWPLHERGTCPVCCAAGSFYMHVVEEDPDKPCTWECNSPEHGKLAVASRRSIGWPDDRGAFHGWQVHIDAFKAGKGVRAYLVETGYLA